MAERNSIRVALQGLRQTEQKMRRLAEGLEKGRDILNMLSSDMQGVWEGNARDCFCESSKELVGSIQTISEQIQERASQLSEAVAVYENTERQAEEMVEDLSADNIF